MHVLASALRLGGWNREVGVVVFFKSGIVVLYLLYLVITIEHKDPLCKYHSPR